MSPSALRILLRVNGVSVSGSAPSGRPARFALGAVGLVLLFGLGYRISLRRLRAAAG